MLTLLVGEPVFFEGDSLFDDFLTNVLFLSDSRVLLLWRVSLLEPSNGLSNYSSMLF